jgi:hypothetical protein
MQWEELTTKARALHGMAARRLAEGELGAALATVLCRSSFARAAAPQHPAVFGTAHRQPPRSSPTSEHAHACDPKAPGWATPTPVHHGIMPTHRLASVDNLSKLRPCPYGLHIALLSRLVQARGRRLCLARCRHHYASGNQNISHSCRGFLQTSR